MSVSKATKLVKAADKALSRDSIDDVEALANHMKAMKLLNKARDILQKASDADEGAGQLAAEVGEKIAESSSRIAKIDKRVESEVASDNAASEEDKAIAAFKARTKQCW